MALKVFNTLTNKKEEFVPLHEGYVGMYVCGPTVYGSAHLGHAKSYISFDIINRYLRYLGYKVKYVQNITDVGHLVGDGDEGESKVEKQAKIEKLDPYQIAYKYEVEYFNCMDKLNVLRPDISCRATSHIEEIIEMVKTLVDKGYAYVTEENNVYYDITKFANYGKLSNRNITNTISGTRINISTDKKRPEDFALWKSADATHLMQWNSPWGVGYPGWHIECSVMSKKYLGETFDIHGGGMDNIFPHHECEIAQSEAANGTQFVKYFLHNNLVTVNGRKMGKSLGNFITLPELFANYNPMVIRFYILLTHYRSNTDFVDEKIKEAAESYNSISKTFNKLPNELLTELNDQEIITIKDNFLNAMDEDFNTSLAISYIYELTKIINKTSDNNKLKNIATLVEKTIKPILGLTFETLDKTSDSELSNKLIEYLINKRDLAKKEKNFETADEIRNELSSLGVTLKDTREGTTYSIDINS